MEDKKSLKIIKYIGCSIGGLYVLIVILSKIFGWEEYVRFYPPCIFYDWTGLYCAGCGSGRAITNLLHGNFYIAFRMNILLFLLMPILIIDLYRYYRYNGKKKLISGWWLVIVIIAYTILRNVPAFSFLAPL